MNDQEKNPIGGWIPKEGYISAREIADRLKLKSVPHLQEELDKLGIEHKSICGKRLYQCSSLERLFWESQ